MPFISPQPLCDYYGLELTERTEGDSAVLTIGGVELLAKLGQGYMAMDGRYLYTPEDYIIVGGHVCLPCDAAGRIFGISLTQNPHFFLTFPFYDLLCL